MQNTLFTPIQEKIYLTILKNPEIQLSQLSRMTKIHRPRLYKEIRILEKSGSILKITKGRSTFYTAANPQNLTNRIDALHKKQVSTLSNLTSLYNLHNKNTSIEIFQGRESIKKAYEILVHAIPKNGKIYHFESLLKSQKSKIYMPQIYIDRCREGGNIDRYVITNKDTKERRRPKLNRYSRVLEGGSFNQNIAQVIGEEHVLFFDYQSETVILFTGRLFAEFQKSIFLSLYSKL